MAEQLTLDGIEPGGPAPRRAPPKMPPKPHAAHTVFFALRPSPDDARRLHALALQLDQLHSLRSQPQAADRLHVSLHSLGEYDTVPQGLIRRACQVADTLVLQPFDVVFDKAMVFNGNAPYVLCSRVEPVTLRQLWLDLGIAIANAFPLLKVKPDFTPHMTLAYKGKLKLEHSIDPVLWPAYELVLINSHYGKTVHEVLGRWPLPLA